MPRSCSSTNANGNSKSGDTRRKKTKGRPGRVVWSPWRSLVKLRSTKQQHHFYIKILLIAKAKATPLENQAYCAKWFLPFYYWLLVRFSTLLLRLLLQSGTILAWYWSRKQPMIHRLVRWRLCNDFTGFTDFRKLFWTADFFTRIKTEIFSVSPVKVKTTIVTSRMSLESMLESQLFKRAYLTYLAEQWLPFLLFIGKLIF